MKSGTYAGRTGTVTALPKNENDNLTMDFDSDAEAEAEEGAEPILSMD